jgi:diguanylate cyclase (GGDEF)-like protein/PAS domain S-box-containing protein
MNISPVLRLSVGLVGLISCVFILADLVFGVLPDELTHTQTTRALIASLVTEQITPQLATQDTSTIKKSLDDLRQQHAGLQAILVYKQNGDMLASSGVYPLPGSTQDKQLDHVKALVHSPQGLWGNIDFLFPAFAPKSWLDWLTSRRIWLPVGIVAFMVLCAQLYLRRALTYLNPMSVVPERVRTAFDSLHEGVALLDASGRVMLANRALRTLAGVEEIKMNSRPFDQAAEMYFPEPLSQFPWRMAVESAHIVLGIRVIVGSGDKAKTVSMDCSPIIDQRGKVRGCMVTMADLTDIERSNDQLRQSLAQLEQSKTIIEEQNQKLTLLALHDGLTGLLNRRAFFETAQAVLQRCQEADVPVAVVMLDVDHFKSFNDKYGHALGDLVLQRVAKSLQDSLRTTDMCARYGGEEFCVLMENLSAQEALSIAERIRANIEQHAGDAIHNGATLTVTASLGVCASPADQPLTSLLHQADEALYIAKRSGRNRVHRSTPAPATAVAID